MTEEERKQGYVGAVASRRLHKKEARARLGPSGFCVCALCVCASVCVHLCGLFVVSE